MCPLPARLALREEGLALREEGLALREEEGPGVVVEPGLADLVGQVEVGDLFAFLLSPRAGYLTGAVINIDGGTRF